jgi:hypothetical protein
MASRTNAGGEAIESPKKKRKRKAPAVPDPPEWNPDAMHPPLQLRVELMDYQLYAIEEALAHHGRRMIVLGTGLGKSITCFRTLMSYFHNSCSLHWMQWQPVLQRALPGFGPSLLSLVFGYAEDWCRYDEWPRQSLVILTMANMLEAFANDLVKTTTLPREVIRAWTKCPAKGALTKRFPAVFGAGASVASPYGASAEGASSTPRGTPHSTSSSFSVNETEAMLAWMSRHRTYRPWVEILTHDQAVKHAAWLGSRRHCYIVDESQTYKNRGSKRTQVALPLLQAAHRVLEATATPLNRPCDMYPQARIIDPTFYPNYTDYISIFANDGRPVQYKQVANGVSILQDRGIGHRNKARLQRELSERIMTCITDRNDPRFVPSPTFGRLYRRHYPILPPRGEAALRGTPPTSAERVLRTLGPSGPGVSLSVPSAPATTIQTHVILVHLDMEATDKERELSRHVARVKPLLLPHMPPDLARLTMAYLHPNGCAQRRRTMTARMQKLFAKGDDTAMVAAALAKHSSSNPYSFEAQFGQVYSLTLNYKTPAVFRVLDRLAAVFRRDPHRKVVVFASRKDLADPMERYWNTVLFPGNPSPDTVLFPTNQGPDTVLFPANQGPDTVLFPANQGPDTVLFPGNPRPDAIPPDANVPKVKRKAKEDRPKTPKKHKGTAVKTTPRPKPPVAKESTNGIPGPSMVRIHGGVAKDKREACAQRFRTDPSCRAMMAGYMSGGVGMDFSSADMCIMAEPPSQFTVWAQAVGRIKRLTQRKPKIYVFMLNLDGSLDDVLVKMCTGKGEFISKVLDTEQCRLVVDEECTLNNVFQSMEL